MSKHKPQLDRKAMLEVLQLARIFQQLQEPERKQMEAEKTREALLQRLLITQQAAQQRQRPQVTGLSGLQSVLGRAQATRTELLRDVDPEDAEAVQAAENQAAIANRPEAQFLRAMAVALAQAGDAPSAALGQQLADIVVPPTKKQLSRRRVRAAARARATGEKPGTFAVTGGPRAGFRAEGTPAQILQQLIETRPEALKRKFGATRKPVREPAPAAAPVTPPPAFAPQFPALPPEAGIGGQEPDLLMDLFRLLSGAGTAPGQLGA